MFDVRQEITAGNTLVREAIQSQNFVAGSAGWQIKANGDAEFSNLVARGSLIAGPVPGRHIEINTPGHTAEIVFYTGVNGETPSTLSPQPFASGVVTFQTAQELNLTSPLVRIGTVGNTLVVNPDANSFGVMTIEGSANWVGVPLVNTWVDVAGARAQYIRDATGGVFLRGQVSNVNGAASNTLIGTLPVGYRPTQSVQFAQRAGAGAGVTAALQITTNGDIISLTNVAQSSALFRLECYFSTL